MQECSFKKSAFKYPTFHGKKHILLLEDLLTYSFLQLLKYLLTVFKGQLSLILGIIFF